MELDELTEQQRIARHFRERFENGLKNWLIPQALTEMLEDLQAQIALQQAQIDRLNAFLVLD